MRRKILLVLLIGIAVALPLMSQVWLKGYCLSCLVTFCPEGCTEGMDVRRTFAICAPCEASTPLGPYACTACNFVRIECIPLDSANPCPPYRQDVRPFVNKGGPRPFECVVIASMIFDCVMK